MLAVERDVKPRNMNFAKVDRRGRLIVGGRLDERSINRRCHGTIAFGH